MPSTGYPATNLFKRGWLWDGTGEQSRIEIEFPDGYVTIHLSDPEFADIALEALSQMNAGD